jgi:hypothetical protein
VSRPDFSVPIVFFAAIAAKKAWMAATSFRIVVELAGFIPDLRNVVKRNFHGVK